MAKACQTCPTGKAINGYSKCYDCFEKELQDAIGKPSAFRAASGQSGGKKIVRKARSNFDKSRCPYCLDKLKDSHCGECGVDVTPCGCAFRDNVKCAGCPGHPLNIHEVNFDPTVPHGVEKARCDVQDGFCMSHIQKVPEGQNACNSKFNAVWEQAKTAANNPYSGQDSGYLTETHPEMADFTLPGATMGHKIRKLRGECTQCGRVDHLEEGLCGSCRGEDVASEKDAMFVKADPNPNNQESARARGCYGCYSEHVGHFHNLKGKLVGCCGDYNHCPSMVGLEPPDDLVVHDSSVGHGVRKGDKCPACGGSVTHFDLPEYGRVASCDECEYVGKRNRPQKVVYNPEVPHGVSKATGGPKHFSLDRDDSGFHNVHEGRLNDCTECAKARRNFVIADKGITEDKLGISKEVRLRPGKTYLCGKRLGDSPVDICRLDEDHKGKCSPYFGKAIKCEACKKKVSEADVNRGFCPGCGGSTLDMLGFPQNKRFEAPPDKKYRLSILLNGEHIPIGEAQGQSHLEALKNNFRSAGLQSQLKNLDEFPASVGEEQHPKGCKYNCRSYNLGGLGDDNQPALTHVEEIRMAKSETITSSGPISLEKLLAAAGRAKDREASDKDSRPSRMDAKVLEKELQVIISKDQYKDPSNFKDLKPFKATNQAPQLVKPVGQEPKGISEGDSRKFANLVDHFVDAYSLSPKLTPGQHVDKATRELLDNLRTRPVVGSPHAHVKGIAREVFDGNSDNLGFTSEINDETSHAFADHVLEKFPHWFR